MEHLATLVVIRGGLEKILNKEIKVSSVELMN
jgi:hypothetical protein